MVNSIPSLVMVNSFKFTVQNLPHGLCRTWNDMVVLVQELGKILILTRSLRRFTQRFFARYARGCFGNGPRLQQSWQQTAH